MYLKTTPTSGVSISHNKIYYANTMVISIYRNTNTFAALIYNLIDMFILCNKTSAQFYC